MSNLTPKETLVLEIAKKVIDFYGGGVINTKELRIATEHYLKEIEELKSREEIRKANATNWMP